MTDATRILSQIEQGDPGAAERLLPLVYDELRKLAGAKLTGEKPGQTLQATALVHEAYLRLVDVDKVQHWDSRGHFFAAAAEAMRRILVDHARRKAAKKRGGSVNLLKIDAIDIAINAAPDQLLLRFISTSDSLNTLLNRIRPEDWDAPCYIPPGIQPARNLMRLRIFELALHGWDIRSPIEGSAALSMETLPSLVEMAWEILRWMFRPGERLTMPVRYYFDVSGAVPVQRHIVVEGDKAWIEAPPKTPGPNVTFRCYTETYALLVFGRISVESAATEGRLEIQGDSSLASKFSWWFQGP